MYSFPSTLTCAFSRATARLPPAPPFPPPLGRHHFAAATPPYPACPLRRPPDPAHTAPAAPIKTRPRQSTSSPPVSTPVPAAPSPLPGASCISPEHSFPA